MGSPIISAFPEEDEQLGSVMRSSAAPPAVTAPMPTAFPVDRTDRLTDGLSNPESPDTAARIFSLQAKTGAPVETIRENLEEFEREAAATNFDPEVFRRTNPKVSAWLESHPLNGALAKDDLVPLTGMEKAMRLGGSLVGRVQAGYYGASAGLYGAIQSFLENARHEGAKEVERALVQSGVSLEEARRRRQEAERAPNPEAEFIGGIRQHLEAVAASKRGARGDEGLIERGVLGGVESATQMGLLLPISLLTKSPAPMIAGAGVFSYGSSYGQARDAGRDVNTATGFAALNAAVEMGTEAIPASKLLENFGSSIAKQFGAQLAAEIPGEQIATVLQDLNEWAVLHPDKPFADYLAERPSAAAETLIATIVGSAVTAGGLKGAERAARAAAGERFVRDMGQSAAGSKTRERSPEKFAEFVQQVAKAEGVETVYAPIDTFRTYFQMKGIDPVTMAEQLTGNPNAYADAVQTGADLAIPVGTYATKLAPTEHNAFFAQELRMAPGEFNAREAAAFQEQQKAIAEKDAAEGARPLSEEEQLREEITGQLTAAGFEQRTAGGLAQALEAGIGNLSRRAGQDPRAVYAAYGLQVRRMTEAEAEQGGHGAARPAGKPAGPVTEQDTLTESPENLAAAGAPAEEIPGLAALEQSLGAGALESVQVAGDEGIQENASGESDASLEAMNRLTGMRARGERFVVFDRAGRRRPVIGPDAVDYRAKKGETFGVEGPDGFRVLDDNGGRYTSERESDADRTQAGERPRDSDAQRDPADEAGGTDEGRGDGASAQRRRLPSPLDLAESDAEGFQERTPEEDAARLTEPVTRELGRIAEELNEFPYQGRTWSWLGPQGDKSGNAAGGEANIVAGSAGAKVYDDVLNFAPLTRKGKSGELAKMVRGTRAQVETAIRKLLKSGRITSNLMEGAVRVAERRAADDYRHINRPELPPSWGVEVDPAFVEDLSDAIDEGLEDADTSFDPKTFGQGLFDVLDAALAEEAPKPSPTALRVGSVIKFREGIAYQVERLVAGKARLLEVGADVNDTTRDLYVSPPTILELVEDGSITEINGLTGPELQALLLEKRGGPKTDILDTGEAQPRLPGAEDVRETEIATPEMEAPFSLTAPVDKGTRGKQRTLFQEGRTPAERLEALPIVRGVVKPPAVARALPFPFITDEAASRLYAARDVVNPPTTKIVPLSKIVATQATFTTEVAREYLTNPPADTIEAFEFEGVTYLAGGHHRAVAAWANGAESIEVQSRPVLEDALEGGAPDLRARTYEQPRRGSFHISADRKVTINLFEKADLSTFLHETGHFFRQVARDLATQIEQIPEAQRTRDQQQLIADVAAIDLWVSDQADETAQEEKFARGFETYLMEGKAPSLELREAFARFRAWLVSIYRSLTALNAPLTDDVRAVFDRMLATDSAIALVEEQGRMAPLFLSAEAAGMTPERFALYEEQLRDASRSARERLEAKALAETRREQQAQWKAERETIRGEVEKQAHAAPVYQALAAMQRGTFPDGTPLVEGETPEPLKLSRKILVERYGEDRLKTLPKPFIYSREGGLDPDAVAQRYGYTSGDELLQHVSTVDPMTLAIERETDRRMLARHGSMFLDGTIQEEAQAAVADEVREGVIRAEIRALRDLARTVDPFVKQAESEGRRVAREAERERDYERRWFEAETKLRIAFAEGRKQVEIDKLEKEVQDLKAKARGGAATINRGTPSIVDLRNAARTRVAAMRILDLRPEVYWSASRRSAQKAIEAAARGQYDEAIAHKTQELLNLAIYREMERTREDVDARVREARRMGTPESRKRLAFAGDTYLDQIDGILDRYEFATVSRKVLERRASVRDFVVGLEGEGLPVNLPEEVLNDARRVNYQQLTVEELIGVTDGIAQILHLARLKTRLLKAAEQRELDQVAATMSASIHAHKPARPKTAPSDRRVSEERTRTIGDFFAGHRKLASLLREMDGFQDGGPMVSEIMFRLNEAGAAEAAMNAEAAEKFGALVDAAFPGKEKRDLYRREFVPAVNQPLSRMQRITVALNWGNEGNRDRIRKGLGWTDLQVQAVLDTLSAKDLAFVQGVFDFLESYWPAIEAKQKRVDGLAPEKVEATPIKAANGTIAGGYYPLKYDDRSSAGAIAKMDLEAANAARQAAYNAATTKRGHTKARAESVKEPVRLDFGVMFEHVGQVIHDLTHHETLIDVGRLLGHRDVSSAIIETHGDIVYKQVRNAIRDVAFGNVGARSGFERAVNHIRAGATVAGLGWNVTTAALQVIGLTNSAVRIGPKWVAIGIGRWLRHPTAMVETVKWINEVSPFMRSRSQTQQREINEIRQRLGVNTGTLVGWIDEAISKTTFDQVSRQGIADSFFWMIGVMQRTVDVPTWLGAYEKAMANGETEARAIALADQAVLDSQGGGQIKDLSEVQRGGPMMKLWTNFYSFFNVLYNQSVESAKRTNFKSPAEVGRLASDYMMLFIAPAVLSYMLREAIRPGSSDDDEPFAQRAVWEILGYASGMMLGLREVSGVLAGSFGYEGPAGARFFASLARLGQQVRQGEVDRAATRAAVDVAGAVLHVPAGQVNRTIDGIIALDEGKTNNPLAVVAGAPRK